METIKLEIDHSNKDYKILKIYGEKSIKSSDILIFLEMWQNFFDHCKKENKKFAMIWCVEKTSYINISDLSKIANFYLKNKEMILSSLICTCMIVKSTFFNTFFSIFKRFYKPTKPIKKCKDVVIAYNFIQECLNEKYKNEDIII